MSWSDTFVEQLREMVRLLLYSAQGFSTIRLRHLLYLGFQRSPFFKKFKFNDYLIVECLSCCNSFWRESRKAYGVVFFSFTFHFTESERDESLLVASVVVSNPSDISCVAWKCSSVVIGTGCTHEEDCWMFSLGGRGDHSEWITMANRNSFSKTGGLDLAEGKFRW